MPGPLQLGELSRNNQYILNLTLKHKFEGWLTNFAANLEAVRNGNDIATIPRKPGPAVIIGAGPSLTPGQLRLLKQHRSKLPTIIASDRMLNPLIQVGLAPDFVATVDGDPSIAKFYNVPGLSQPVPGAAVLDALTTHPITLQEATKTFSQVYWFLSFFDDPEEPQCPHCRRFSPTAAFYYMSNRKTIIQALGNVGAFCWHLAYFLGCDPLILVGMDYGYQRTTPIPETHYYNAYMKMAAQEHLGLNTTQQDLEEHLKTCKSCHQRVRDSYEVRTNPDFNRPYLIDILWDTYRNLLLPFIAKAKCRTINASGNGSLHGPGITGLDLETTLEKYCS